MKKKRVNEILINQAKRRRTVLSLLSIIFIVSVISLAFFLIFMKTNKNSYVTYNENSNIDYKVILKDNDFFDKDYLEANKQYIASLIDYINADFKYSLSLNEEDIDYKYSYRIEAEVDVKQKDTGNSLFNKTEVLLNSIEINSAYAFAEISESVKIDYNSYNDLISRFVSTYGLDSIDSTLTISMYINVFGSCESFQENVEKESVISLVMPLTTKTINIDITNNLMNSENTILQCKRDDSYNYVFYIIFSFFLVVDLVLIIRTVRYIIKTRTAENIYERELKKILNNYSSYIQTLSNEFELDKYQMLKLESFTDMLEIRDTIKQPILMKENSLKTAVYFVIPTENKLLYIYRLNVSDIKKDMKKTKRA